jgi:DNA helicase-2/ATP-dependent DNA helicase PcrA
MELWQEEDTPSCLNILKSVQETGLFKLDSRVGEILSEFSEDENAKITALRKGLSVSFDELERYSAYVTDNTRFATHQGIKGLEFPRVMVIMDDTEARGFLFSYEKLFGATPKSETDIRNEREGKDTGIMRTTRLFYVACTRAQKSLAVVAYTKNPEAIKSTAILNGWFSEDEICIV